MGIDSQPLAKRQVYAQDTEPVTQSDGILWVDTSDPARPTYVYSADSGQFEPVSATTLDQLDDRKHSYLTGIGASDHHAKTTNHSELNFGTSDHHDRPTTVHTDGIEGGERQSDTVYPVDSGTFLYEGDTFTLDISDMGVSGLEVVDGGGFVSAVTRIEWEVVLSGVVRDPGWSLEVITSKSDGSTLTDSATGQDNDTVTVANNLSAVHIVTGSEMTFTHDGSTTYDTAAIDGGDIECVFRFTAEQIPAHRHDVI